MKSKTYEDPHYNRVHPPRISSLLCPNILLSTVSVHFP